MSAVRLAWLWAWATGMGLDRLVRRVRRPAQLEEPWGLQWLKVNCKASNGNDLIAFGTLGASVSSRIEVGWRNYLTWQLTPSLRTGRRIVCLDTLSRAAPCQRCLLSLEVLSMAITMCARRGAKTGGSYKQKLVPPSPAGRR